VSKMGPKIKDEIAKLIPPTVFFFLTLHLIALIRSLMLKGTGIPVVSAMALLVGALTLGKAVLIADALPIVNRFPEKPLAYNVVWKTVLYFIAATIIHYLEHLFDAWRVTGSVAAANERLLSEIIWAHFFAIELLLLVILFMYCTMREIVRVIGREKVMEMFFGSP
jgi:hypothetical protein